MSKMTFGEVGSPVQSHTAQKWRSTVYTCLNPTSPLPRCSTLDNDPPGWCSCSQWDLVFSPILIIFSPPILFISKCIVTSGYSLAAREHLECESKEFRVIFIAQKCYHARSNREETYSYMTPSQGLHPWKSVFMNYSSNSVLLHCRESENLTHRTLISLFCNSDLPLPPLRPPGKLVHQRSTWLGFTPTLSYISILIFVRAEFFLI